MPHARKRPGQLTHVISALEVRIRQTEVNRVREAALQTSVISPEARKHNVEAEAEAEADADAGGRDAQRSA